MTWQDQYKQSIITLDDLLQRFNIHNKFKSQLLAATKQFEIRVPPRYLDKIDPSNPNDPLLLQILPQAAELAIHPEYNSSPLSEEKFNPIPGLLHKYTSRVLLITSSACAIHCRYCFRKNFSYSENMPGKNNWQKAFEYINNKSAVKEVILSGGDPFTLNNKYIKFFIQNIEKISHVKTLRFHTRLLANIPDRIDHELIEYLQNTHLKIVIVLHINHPNEIDLLLIEKLNLLKTTCTLLNQSCLLKGVNDSATVLQDLSYSLFNANILPYYIHILDKVQGTQHFAVSSKHAKAIMKQLSAKLPGYLVPKLVTEEVGAPAKSIINL